MNQVAYYPGLPGLNKRHLMGVFLFGFPLLMYRSFWAELLIPPRFTIFSLFIFYLLFILTCQISILSAMNKLKKMPASISVTVVPHKIFFQYILIRSTFLIIYECFFRGLILFNCILYFGVPFAIIINIFIYIGAHIFSDRKELAACLPFGVIICLLSVWLHSVWPAIILHLALSNIHESYILYSPNQTY